MSYKEKKSIGPFGNNMNGFKRFMEGLLQAGKEGWVLPSKDFNLEAKVQKGGSLRVFLVREEEDFELMAPESTEGFIPENLPEDTYEEALQKALEVTPEVASEEAPQEEGVDFAKIEEEILANGRLKKDDMLAFAEHRGIQIPEDIKLPLQIRKVIKEAIEAQSSED